MNWYFRVLRNYAVFAGRARRKEYWMFGLIQGLIIFVLRYPHFFTGTVDPESHLGQIRVLYVFGTFIPLIAVSVRRLHDTNRSGWWFLMFLVPIANLVLFFSFMTQDSQPGENIYGPSPKPEATGGTALQEFDL
jgi:uncharacterized membrane protein YhaH (DUF805 family)